jgi:hypothetical protein
VSAIPSARVAARLREALGIPVEETSGGYGEFTVLVDDEPVIVGGGLTFMGLVPSADTVIEKVRARLGS